MKQNSSIILAGVVFVFSILACSVSINGNNFGGETIRGSGVVVEENRSLGNISSVELTTPGTLHIEIGVSETLRIEAEDNLLDYIQTDVSGDHLVIRTRQGINLRNTQPIDYYLTVEELKQIANSSSGDVEAGELQSKTFSVTISSSGDVTISSLMAETISVNISSSGNLQVSGGQVQQQTIKISSSGEYIARDLVSVEARISLTSSGQATIRVTGQLSGNLSSSGDVYYIGNPQVNVSTTSSGEVVQIKE